MNRADDLALDRAEMRALARADRAAAAADRYRRMMLAAEVELGAALAALDTITAARAAAERNTDR